MTFKLARDVECTRFIGGIAERMTLRAGTKINEFRRETAEGYVVRSSEWGRSRFHLPLVTTDFEEDDGQ